MMADFRPKRKIHDIPCHKRGILKQFRRRLAVIAFQPQTAAHSLEAAASAAQALRSIRPNREMPDLAGVGVSAANHTPAGNDATANARGQSHVEHRVTGFPAPK